MTGRYEKSDKWGEDRSQPTEEKHEELSPFPFLVGLSKDRIDIVHTALLSQITSQAKNEVIHTVLKENKNLDDKYWNWRTKASREISPEILALLSPEDVEKVKDLGNERRYEDAISICFKNSADAGCRMSEWVDKVRSSTRWNEIPFETAENILRKWVAQKDEQEKAENMTETVEHQTREVVSEDDFGYTLASTELESVSALCLQPTKPFIEAAHRNIIHIDDSPSSNVEIPPNSQFTSSNNHAAAVHFPQQNSDASFVHPPGVNPTNIYGYGFYSPPQPQWNQFGNQPKVHFSPQTQHMYPPKPVPVTSVGNHVPIQKNIYPQLAQDQAEPPVDNGIQRMQDQNVWECKPATEYAEVIRSRPQHHTTPREPRLNPSTPVASDRPTTRSMARSRELSEAALPPKTKSRSVSRPKTSNISRTRSSSRPRQQNSQKPRAKALNILLLGETGVGKTTFINGLANYLKFGTLDSALNGEPTILVDASFTMTYKNNRTITISANANCGDDYKKMKNNERLGVSGTSSTQEPVDHLFRWLNEDEEKLIRIIDTPGINDTRGTDQDAKNFDKILNHIADLGELHAICIVMKPNESKFTVGFRYCLDELLVKLHKSATKNILFCFTNTRSTLYRPGDTLSTLHEYLKKIAKETGVMLKADRTNIFCYDNDCFRYLCVLRQLPGARTESSMATFSEGWLHNVKECAKMLKRVQGLSAHVVEDTVTINHTRRVITALARPLAEVARNHVVNMKLVQDHIDEIEQLKKTGRNLDDKMYQEQVVMIPVKLPYPRTVCTSPCCVEYVKINDFEIQTIPKTVCHDDCHLKGITEESFRNPELEHCQAFDLDGTCRVCGCSWKKHMHITFDFQRRKEMVMDRESLRRWENCSDRKKAIEVMVKEQKEKLRQLEKEHEDIRESCAEFSAFLSCNSMKHACDPYADYLGHLIQDEEDKYEHGGGTGDVMIALIDMVDDYTKRVKYIMEEINAGRRQPLTTPQLNNLIESLSRLKLCGPTIAHLKELHLNHTSKLTPKPQLSPPSDLIQEAMHKNGMELSADIGRARNRNNSYTTRDLRRHF